MPADQPLSNSAKVRPIRAALSGRYLDSLVLDEETALAVLKTMEDLRDVA